MKNYKILLISFVIFFFILGAVSAADTNSSDDETEIGGGQNLDDISQEVSSEDPDPILETNDIQEIYVNDTGDDSNLGSSDSPYASIGKAISVVNSSTTTTIHLSEGTFGKDNDTNFLFDPGLKAGNRIIRPSSNIHFLNSIVTFIGAGVDKTFIDGQTANYFMSVKFNTTLTFKNITFINFRSSGGAIIDASTSSDLTFENCVFKDSYSTNQKGLISFKSIGKFKVIDSKFINDIGGAIVASNVGEVYIANNIFSNITKTSTGLTIYTEKSKVEIKGNKFINLSSTSYDGAFYLDVPNNLNSTVTDNIFINCTTSSESYAIPCLRGSLNFIFERNTFINSTNAKGYNILLEGNMNNLQIIMADKINVSNNEITHGVECHIEGSDDMNNTIFINTNVHHITVNMIGDVYNYTPVYYGREAKLQFTEVPENGIYNVTITYNNGDSTTDILSTINVSASNNPVDIYISPGGSVMGNGTFENPFKTIKMGIDVGFEKSFTVYLHLLEGAFSGEDNVALNIANKGNLKIIGEYNKTIIDGENANWFMSVSSCIVNVENVSFVNGVSSNKNLFSGNTLYLNNCIIDNCNANVIVEYAHLSNLFYTNNNGYISVSRFYSEYIVNSTFINNTGKTNYGVLYLNNPDFILENCRFIDNTAESGVIMANTGFKSINNCFANNHGSDCGVIYIFAPSSEEDNPSYEYYFKNNTFINNNASSNGVFKSYISEFELFGAPNIEFINCKFINNSAQKAGVGTLKFANFTNCLFANNTADYGGVLVVFPTSESTKHSLNFVNVVFENNTAINGNDLYFDIQSGLSTYVLENLLYLYPVDLTISFNDLNVSTLSDELTASVYGPCGAVVGGILVNFKLNNEIIGSANTVNSLATLKYSGFVKGNFTLSGNANGAAINTIINNGSVNVGLENVLSSIDYWVSNKGSDETGNGSETNPFKTIQCAVDKASLNSRNITVHLLEETYKGSPLTLSSMNSIKIVGKGTDKTFIDGENANYFARITNGRNQVEISNLTIKNIVTVSSESDISPITVDEGGNLQFNNVVLTHFNGIIENNGNLFINNTLIETGYGYIKGNVVINNSVIKDIIAKSLFRLIFGDNCTIENTEIYNYCNNNSLKEWGMSNQTSINPAFAIESRVVNMVNCSMVNCFASPVNEYQIVGDGSYLSPFGYSYTKDKILNIHNSSFNNFTCLVGVNAPANEVIFNFDGCLFENFAEIAKILNGGKFNITNSIFLNSEMCIDNKNYEGTSQYSFNDNYWSSNSKPLIAYVNPRGGFKEPFEPSTWIILVVENGNPVFKFTDGENLTDYSGSLPAEISYVNDENGDVIAVLNVAGTGYKFDVDENGSAILNTTAPMKNIVPKVLADVTVFASDVILYKGENVVFAANFTDKWGDSLKNTNVSFIIGDDTINKTTDENGFASFVVDFALGKYTVTLTNPVTGQIIFKTINVITNETISAADVTAKYNDGSKFTATFTDQYGNALANTEVSFKVGDKVINATTDSNGVASFVIDFNAGNYEVVISNPGTGENIIKALTITKIDDVKPSNKSVTTKLTATKVSTVYNIAKNIVITLNDAKNEAIPNAKVIIKLNGKSVTKTTDKNGQIKYAVILPAEKYTATITFEGDENYAKSTTSANVVVKKASPKMTAKKATFKVKKAKKYAIALKDNKGKAMKKVKVTLTTKVKGKKIKITVKTNAKGKATFNLKKLAKKGKYTATIKFAGNKNFNAVTKSVKINVKK